MATEQELQININTLANTIGLEKTAAALEKMAVSAQSAGTMTAKTGQQVAQAGQRGADGLNVMAAASAVMQGNFQAAANAAVPLLEKSKAINLSMTQLSLAGAAFSAVIAGLRALSEWADRAAMRIAQIQMDNLTKKVNASATAYDELLKSMQKTAAEKDATLAYNNAMVDSYTRQALAINELNKQRELAATTDETMRQQIEAKYASKAASISGMADVQKEANERKRSLEREEEIQKAIESSKARQAELLNEARESLAKGQSNSATAQSSIGFWGFLLGGKQGKFDSYQGLSKEAGTVTQESIKKAQEEEARRDQLEADRLELLRLREVFSLNTRSGSLSRAAADVADRTASADRERASQAAISDAAKQLDSVASEFSPADQQLIVDTIRATKEAGRLTSSVIGEFTNYLRDIKDQLNRQRYQ